MITNFINKYIFVRSKNKGEALVTILFFIFIALTITTAAMLIVVINTQGHQSLADGNASYFVAESGIDEAVLRLMRDSGYARLSQPGESLSFTYIAGSLNETAAVTVAASNDSNCTSVITPTPLNYSCISYTITSVGRSQQAVRTIQATLSSANNVYTISDWREIN